MLKAVTNSKTIAYNEGLGKQVDALNQQFDGISKRFDTHNKHMNEITSENEALNADFKQAGQYLANNTYVLNNKFIPALQQLIAKLNQGINVSTSEVSADVYKYFKQETGLSIQELIENELYKNLTQATKKGQQASLNARLYAGVAKDYLAQIKQEFDAFRNYSKYLIFEFGLIIGFTMILPIGWIRFLGAIGTATLCWLFNEWLKQGEGGQDD